MQELERILTQIGPSLSSEVAKRLVGNGLSGEAARQRISRARAPIKRLKLKFPHNERFVFLSSQEGSDVYWANISAAFRSTGTAYGNAFFSLLGRGGCLPKTHFASISGSPGRLKGQLSWQTVAKGLVDVGLIDSGVQPGLLGDCWEVVPDCYPSDPVETVRARMLAEAIVLLKVRDWTKKLGLVSFESVRVRGDAKPPDFCHFGWDYSAPSYAHPNRINSQDRVSPGFVVADVALNHLDVDSVRYFISKSRIARSMKNTAPFMSLLIAESFSPEAFKHGRQHGLIFTTPGLLFGDEVGEALRNLVSVLSHAAAAAAKNPEVVDKLMRSLGKIEGAAGNLRGPLFELLVAHTVLVREGGSVDIGVVATNKSGNKAEIDVLRVKEKTEVCAYECRGKLDGRIGAKEATQWLDKIGVALGWIRRQPRFHGCAIKFELWTTGGFTNDAVKVLKRRQREIKSCEIMWRDGRAVKTYVHALKNKSLTNTLNEHYFKNPLTAPIS